MATAADMEQLDALTITHTHSIFQTALEGGSQPTRIPKQRCTKTQTEIVTVTLAEDIPLTTSLLPPHTVARSGSGSFQWPGPHGIVPGSTRVLHSPQSATPQPSADSQPQIPPYTTSTRRSTYPRPSPPGFLYPQAIVPRAAYEQQLMQHPTMPGTSSNVIWYLPYGLEVLIFIIMFLGLAWTVLVCLINFPPRTWDFTQAKKHDRKSKRKRSWWTRFMAWRPWDEEDNRKERRPHDKPSKIPRNLQRPSTEREDTSGDVTPTTTSAQTPSMYLHENTHLEEQGIELTHRAQHRRRQPTPTNQTHNEHRRFYSSPTTAVRFPTASPTSSITSPPNPFLRPPDSSFPPQPSMLHALNSPDWLASHAAFFASLSASRSSPPSIASSTSSEYAHMDISDMEALEAGTAPLTPRVTKKHERKGSWVDLGLTTMEDVVNGFVGRVVRWTDDEGGEQVLLPVVNGRWGVKVT